MSLGLRYNYSDRSIFASDAWNAAATRVVLRPSGRFESYCEAMDAEWVDRHRRARDFADYEEAKLPRFQAEVGGVVLLSPEGERLERAPSFAVRRQDGRHVLCAIHREETVVASAEGPRTWRLADGRRLPRLVIATDYMSALPLKEPPRGRPSALAAERLAA